MSRYFYDCAIKAAYMAKHFGIKFEGHRNESGASIGDILLDLLCMEADTYFNIKIDALGRYYIHPEILPLLEPAVGDLCQDGGLAGTVENIKGKLVCPVAGGQSLDRLSMYTIKRNNTAFIWPESEG
jgi:hypothetical protein